MRNEIGKTLKYFCKANGQWIKQKQIAKKSKLSQSAIAQFISGGKTPSIHSLRKICKALGISMADFFNQMELLK